MLDSYAKNVKTTDEAIGAVASHEAVHVADPKNIKMQTDPSSTSNAEEDKEPRKHEINVNNETGTNNKQINGDVQ